MQKWMILIATFFGAGKMKPAPGTWGTVAALPFAMGLMAAGPLWHMLACLLMFPLSIVASEAYEKISGSHDAKEIVIDEVLGVWVALVWLPLTWQSVLAGFVLFRFFDILKPFPISWVDKKVKGGVGVVLDDLLAGVIVNLILNVVYTQTNWLGSQLLVLS